MLAREGVLVVPQQEQIPGDVMRDRTGAESMLRGGKIPGKSHPLHSHPLMIWFLER
jgi:hypothetical protein